MAGNSGSTKEAALAFMDKVEAILQNATPELMDNLFRYLHSVGVRSEADIDKVDESTLGDVIGEENARTLLVYFKEQEYAKREAPASSAPASSSYCAASGGTTVSRRPVDPSEGFYGVMDRFMQMQMMQNEQTQRMVAASQENQNKTLGTVTKVMSDMVSMHKVTLDKMGEQMTQQSKMHQETMHAMNDQMKTTAKMHNDTLQTVHRGMAEAQRMNADTLTQVTKTMTTAMEGQERRMQESSRSQSQMHQEAMRAMNTQMQATAAMHAQTLETVQRGMTEAQRMNADTLTHVTTSLRDAMEAQEESMRDYRRRLEERDNDSCRLM